MLTAIALANFRALVRPGPTGAYDSIPHLSPAGISLAAFERGGAHDSYPIGQSLSDLKAFLSFNLPPTAVAKASGLLKIFLSNLDIDDDCELDPAADLSMDSAKATARRRLAADNESRDAAAFARRYPDAAKIRILGGR